SESRYHRGSLSVSPGVWQEWGLAGLPGGRAARTGSLYRLTNGMVSQEWWSTRALSRSVLQSPAHDARDPHQFIVEVRGWLAPPIDELMQAGFFRDQDLDDPVLTLQDDHAFLPLDVDPAVRRKHRADLNGGPEDLAIDKAGLWQVALDRDGKPSAGECTGEHQRGKNHI